MLVPYISYIFHRISYTLYICHSSGVVIIFLFYKSVQNCLKCLKMQRENVYGVTYIPSVGGIVRVHVETQVVPLFSQSMTIKGVFSVLNEDRYHYEKCFVHGQRFLTSENERRVLMVVRWITWTGDDVTVKMSTRWNARCWAIGKWLTTSEKFHIRSGRATFG